jgi:hypothetical protein
MKQYQPAIDQNKFSLDEVSEGLFYGTLREDGQKGVVFKDKLFGGTYQIAPAIAFHRGDIYGYTDKSLKELIRKAGEGFEIFQFDTHKELFLWLAE